MFWNLYYTAKPLILTHIWGLIFYSEYNTPSDSIRKSSDSFIPIVKSKIIPVWEGLYIVMILCILQNTFFKESTPQSYIKYTIYYIKNPIIYDFCYVFSRYDPIANDIFTYISRYKPQF